MSIRNVTKKTNMFETININRKNVAKNGEKKCGRKTDFQPKQTNNTLYTKKYTFGSQCSSMYRVTQKVILFFS